jgi:polyphosphate kinase
MSLVYPVIEKELSWLSFNERVLQEAADVNVPIIERIRFLGIFSNNMDEFFRVRVADVQRLILINRINGSDEKAIALLSKIQSKVLNLTRKFDEVYLSSLQDLASRHIFLINDEQLTETQGEWVKHYFKANVLQHITPIICTDNVDLTHVLEDDVTYLVVKLSNQKKNLTNYSFLEVPSEDVPRFIELPREKGQKKRSIIMLDNILRYCLNTIFDSLIPYDSAKAYSMKLTRDAEYGLSDDIDQSILEKMSLSLKQRLTAEPVRLVHDREMPEKSLKFILNKLGIDNSDSVIPGGRYHNFRDFIGFPNIGRSYLEYETMPAIESKDFRRHSTIYHAISEKDILLYYPYHQFNHLIEFVRQSAFDPKVSSIKISIYRVAKNSLIINSLINAARNGKKVMVVVELRARFDEEANIDCAKQLTEAGIKVEFGIPSLKCHTKVCIVTRQEKGMFVQYAHIGTGNFNEKTAKIYTDFSLFTKNIDITREVEQVFDFICNSYKHYEFKHLIVSPNDTRNRLYELIDSEIKYAKKGLHASIQIKVNNLVDGGIVDRLYQASAAGVKIQIIVRGMCSLRPGIIGLSENIHVISIVDRFLEHARVAIFYNKGERNIYISSADWMTRNFDKRVEVGCPIYDKKLQQRIVDIFEIQWSDNTKSRVIDCEQNNNYKTRGNKRKVRSQTAIYDYIRKKEA